MGGGCPGCQTLLFDCLNFCLNQEQCNAIRFSRWIYTQHICTCILMFFPFTTFTTPHHPKPNKLLPLHISYTILYYSRQPSASQGHDGGNSKYMFAPANSTPKCNPKKGNSQQNETSRYTPMKKGGRPDFLSPTMASTDIFTPVYGYGYASDSGNAYAASNRTRSKKTPPASNASTPPLRHVKSIRAEEYGGVEAWYQK